MAYNFKSIADVEVVAEPTESANVLIEENGMIKKAPKTAVGGADDAVFIHYDSDTDSVIAVTPNAFKVILDGFSNCLGVAIFVLQRWNKQEFSMITCNGIYLGGNDDEHGRYVRVDAEGLIIQLYEDGHIDNMWAD